MPGLFLQEWHWPISLRGFSGVFVQLTLALTSHSLRTHFALTRTHFALTRTHFALTRTHLALTKAGGCIFECFFSCFYRFKNRSICKWFSKAGNMPQWRQKCSRIVPKLTKNWIPERLQRFFGKVLFCSIKQRFLGVRGVRNRRKHHQKLVLKNNRKN